MYAIGRGLFMLTIGQLSKLIGVSVDTIRYYKRIGLLHPTQRLNGYYEYSLTDAILVLYTRELRGNKLSLNTIRSSYGFNSIQSYYDLLLSQEEELLDRMKALELLISRINETRTYVECGIGLYSRGKCEIYAGNSTWTIGGFDDINLDKNQKLGCWVKSFPFSYVAFTISKEELEYRQGNEPYTISVGYGALEKYVREFSLPLDESAKHHPTANYARTCIVVRDIFSITPDDVSPLTSFVTNMGYRLPDGIGGRLFFIEDIYNKPLFYLMIWGRIEPNI